MRYTGRTLARLVLPATILLWTTAWAADPPQAGGPLYEMEVMGVAPDPASGAPVVYLRGKEDKRAGGEDLMVLGTHVFDLMRQFAGDPLWVAGQVTAQGVEIQRRDVREGNEGLGPLAGDTITGMYAFRGGINGYFASRAGDEIGGTRWGLDLYGSRGFMTIRADMSPTVHICRTVKWTDAPWERLVLPGDPPPRDTNEANRGLVADLLEAIEQNREPRASGREARWTIEMALALYESQRMGGRVYFPLRRRDHPLLS